MKEDILIRVKGNKLLGGGLTNLQYTLKLKLFLNVFL